MAQHRRPQRKETVAAQVFLRSVSGRSLSEIADDAAPEDIAPFRPTQAALTAVRKYLIDAGFEVFDDEMGLTLSIEGPPAAFARIFGVKAEELASARADVPFPLRPPREIQEFVREIFLLPKPTFF